MTGGDDDRTRPGAGSEPLPPGMGADPRHDERTLAGASLPPKPSVPGVTLDREIARGGMGVVYRGHQDYLDREVAVKVLSEQLQGGTFAQRFQREAKILAGIKHPNIVACHMAGVNDHGLCYLVMEFVDGPTLKDWVEANGPMHPESVLHLAKALASALSHAHDLNIIHRDVKAENVLLEGKTSTTIDPRFPYSPKLVDLGIARIHSESGSHEIGLTSPGSVVGTPTCMAPEQFDTPELVDFRADIYGLGCVLYRALTGKVAFDGGKLTSLVMQKREPVGPDPRKERPELPAPLAEFVQSLMAGDRDQRPPSYQALIARIDELLATDLSPKEAASGGGGGGLLATAEFSFLAEGGLVGSGDDSAAAPGFVETSETDGGPVATEVVESQQVPRPKPDGPKVGMIAGFAVVAVAALGAAWWATQGGGGDDSKGGKDADRSAAAGRADADAAKGSGAGSDAKGIDPQTGPNADPQVSFVLPDKLLKRVPIAIRANGTDPDGDALTYRWSFRGDAEVVFDPVDAESTKATLLYGVPNDPLEIVVTATDARGAQATHAVPIQVGADAPPNNLLELFDAEGSPWVVDDSDAWTKQLEKGFVSTISEGVLRTASIPMDGPAWSLVGELAPDRLNGPECAVMTVRLSVGGRALALRVSRSEFGAAKWTAEALRGVRATQGWEYELLEDADPGTFNPGSVATWRDEERLGLFADFVLTRRGDALELLYGTTEAGMRTASLEAGEVFGEGWADQPMQLTIVSEGGRGKVTRLGLF